MNQLRDDLWQDYLSETQDHLATIESGLLDIEISGTAADEAGLKRVLTSLHAIKSGAGIFEFVHVRALAHQAEHVAGLIRARKLAPDSAVINKLLRATDTLRDLLRSSVAGNGVDICGVMAELAALTIDESDRKPRSSNPAAPEPGKLRSLLVEDDFSSRLLLHTFLARYGECHVAVNGLESIAAVRTALDRDEPYHLICMDIMMPEMGGREAVRRIRDMEDALDILPTDGAKIIMTTTVNDIKEVASCFRELCDAYQVKPIDLGKLLQQMKSYGLVPEA